MPLSTTTPRGGDGGGPPGPVSPGGGDDGGTSGGARTLTCLEVLGELFRIEGAELMQEMAVQVCGAQADL